MFEEYLAHHFEQNYKDGFDIEQPAAKPAGQ
jgi:putative transposase